ncbi:MAG: ABC transporter substrate-binding protein [Treponema sp. GWB1_62_6]|nr:MAG: ABC transporter substrate-binding protein [Treponema sp. GWA1_62_8]OHE66930.1 MAG: ABC transporter substrate-binding protein [Treponema sp. GWC1_61_84]OHE70222.1 MAG: ABC transporter substrate-binding protein [Treponema sp. GWB1_62_6]HCM25521.1 sugar ABC transporter substrate-binding protein [Treponema sp.]
MLKKLSVLAFVLVLAVSSLVAAPSAEKPAKATELRFIDVSPSPTRQEYFTKTFDKFKQETGITVVYESVPWDDAANKLTVLGASNQLPDVMTTWAGWLGQFTEAKWIVPLNEYIGTTTDEYAKTVTQLVWKSEKELYGNIYTIPDGMMVKGVFVRKDWAKDAGLKLDPKKGWTYKDYFDAVYKLTDSSKNHYGTSFRGSRGAFDPLFVYLESFNGGAAYSADGSALFDSSESLEAYKRWNGLYLDGAAPKDAINWGFVEMVSNFTGGLTGTLINDSEVAATCIENMTAAQWTVMPMPRSDKDGKIYNTVNSPYAYSISASSKNKDASWKLIQFLTRPDNNIEYCKLTGLIPIKTAVGNDPFYGPNGPYATFVQQLNDPAMVVPCAFGPFNYTDMHQGTMHEEMQKYLLGKQDAATSLANVSNELEKRMKEYLAANPGSAVEKPKGLF